MFLSGYTKIASCSAKCGNSADSTRKFKKFLSSQKLCPLSEFRPTQPLYIPYVMSLPVYRTFCYWSNHLVNIFVPSSSNCRLTFLKAREQKIEPHWLELVINHEWKTIQVVSRYRRAQQYQGGSFISPKKVHARQMTTNVHKHQTTCILLTKISQQNVEKSIKLLLRNV